jgi:cation/acetate symporter
MVALFCGTAALPHVLIRYYTVRDSTAARRSTIVAISAIGLFYILTLYLGLGAIANGVLNPQTDNMSAPLLARSFGEVLFAIITALAFATVLGTVSGLIVAASGAVANDLLDRFLKRSMSGTTKVLAAKLTAVTVGVVAVVFGILFRGVNVGFLVGWAFAVAASANFPAIIMVLFWKRTTPAGIISSIFVGIVASLGVILAGPDMFKLYGLPEVDAWIPLGQPAILSMPLSFLTLVAVSLATPNGRATDRTDHPEAKIEA